MKDLELPQNLSEQFEVAGRALRDAFGIEVRESVLLGGGTVLAMYYEHRISTDLDFFAKKPPSEMAKLFANAEEKLAYVLNVAEVNITSGFITFNVNETNVSVFTSPYLTDSKPYARESHFEIELEPAEEILTKKAQARIMGNGIFAIRDFYDFCVAWRQDRRAYDAFLTHFAKSDRDEIVRELRQWRSSPLVLNANKEPLLSPVYPRLAENVWDYSLDLFSGRGIPEYAFSR